MNNHYAHINKSQALFTFICVYGIYEYLPRRYAKILMLRLRTFSHANNATKYTLYTTCLYMIWTMENGWQRLVRQHTLFVCIVYWWCIIAINDMFSFMFDNKNAFASQRIASNQIYFDKAEKNWANNSFNHIQIDKIVLRSIYSPYTGAIIAIWGLGQRQ